MEIVSVVYFFIILIASAIIHEYAHGWMAFQLGDQTAKYAGRLTLDPRAHIDPFGTILMPLILLLVSQGSFLFAYAKPVPFNPYNLKDRKWGPVWVAIAGPTSNLILAVFFGGIIQLFPLGGPIIELFKGIVYVNILLAVFNLVPIPPLDGSKVLYALLPDSLNHVKVALEKWGFVLLLMFVFFFFQLIMPIINLLFGLFTGGFQLF